MLKEIIPFLLSHDLRQEVKRLRHKHLPQSLPQQVGATAGEEQQSSSVAQHVQRKHDGQEVHRPICEVGEFDEEERRNSTSFVDFGFSKNLRTKHVILHPIVVVVVLATVVRLNILGGRFVKR